MAVFLAHFIVKDDVNVFREAELTALCNLVCGEDPARARVLGSAPDDPLWCIELLSDFRDQNVPLLAVMLPGLDAARDIARRSMLLRAVYRPFCPSLTSKGALASRFAEDGHITDGSQAADEPQFASLSSALAHPGPFRYHVEGLDRKVTPESKVSLLDLIKHLRHKGITDLGDPSAAIFKLFVTHTPSGDVKSLFFALHVADSGRCDLLDRYSLKARRYIGTTTMPPELTFLMTNLAGVRASSLVLDPFAGTGATLISASHFGAATLGFDMDGRVLRGGAIVGAQASQSLSERLIQIRKRQGTGFDDSAPATFRQNFVDYKLRSADAARLNFSVACNVFAPSIQRHKNMGFLDAIVADPPYGIREQQRRVEGTGQGEEVRLTNKVPWTCGDLMLDLVAFAAVALVVGGRLVYWHPTSRLSYDEREIPAHPSLRVVCNLEQPLSIRIARRLVVMEKVSSPTDAAADVEIMRQALVHPADVRKLMDDTTAGNEAYYAYKAKREASRQAKQAWRTQQEEAGTLPEFRKRLGKAERRQLNMDNRSKNFEAQEQQAAARRGAQAAAADSPDQPKRCRSE